MVGFVLKTSTPENPSADNATDLGTSSLRWQDLYLSGNLYIGGTAAANALDDYEEGTWTPNVQFNNDSTGVTYSNQLGTYTKVGNICTLWLFVTLTNNGTGVGNATIIDLPFSAAASTRNSGGIKINNAADAKVPFASILASTSTINILDAASNSAASFTDTELGGNENIWGTIVYRTA